MEGGLGAILQMVLNLTRHVIWDVIRFSVSPAFSEGGVLDDKTV